MDMTHSRAVKDQAFVTRLLADLVRATPDDLDALLEQGIERVGAIAGADRCYIFRLNDDLEMSNTHEWVAEGTAPAIDQNQNMPLSLVDPWMPDLIEGRHIHLPDVGSWQAEGGLPEVLRSQDIKAILVVPFMHDGELGGFIGFDNTRIATPFSEPTIDLLKAVADIIWVTIRRIESEQARERAEEALRLTTNRFKALFRTLPELFFELDAERRYTGISAGPSDMMIVPMERRAGKRPADVLPGYIAKILDTCMDEAESAGVSKPRRFDRFADGVTQVHEATVAASGRPGDADFRFVAVIRDVTQDAHARNRLERLSKVAELMTNLVVITDRDGNVLWANRAFVEKSGYAVDEITGRSLLDFTRSARTDPETSRQIGEAIEAGRTFRGEILNETRDGEEYWVDLNISAEIDEQGADGILVHVATEITAMKTAEQDAERSRGLLENALSALPDAFAYYDRDDRLVICNDKYREFYPRTAEAMIPGVGYEELLRYGAERGEYSDAIGREEEWVVERLARRGTPKEYIEENLSSGRCIRIIEEPTPDGGRVGMRIDITELKRAEERLAEIIEGAQVGTWEWRRGVDQVITNDRYAAILGHGSEEISGSSVMSHFELVAPDQRADVLHHFEMLLNGQRNQVRREFRMQHAGGRYVWVEMRGRITSRDAEGRTLRISGVLIDISARKESEEALRRSNEDLTRALQERDTAERRFYDVAAISSDWFFELDADLTHSFLSDTFQTITGQDPAELDGRDLSALLPGGKPTEADAAAWDAVRKALDRREAFSNHILSSRKTDGTQIWIRLSAAPFHDVITGAFAGYRGVGSDVTELYNERLKALAASDAKSMFLANMSHEIRTPLNGVLGIADLLAPTLETERQHKMIDTIRNSGELLLRILNNILDMSKIEAGELEIVSAPFSPLAMVEEVAEIYSTLAESKGVGFRLLVSPGAGEGRRGDEHRLKQVLHNLLNNAMKFTSDGEVTLKLSARKNKPLVFEVTDSGIGMTEEQLGNIFQAFRQAGADISARYGGTGLGLAVVRDMTRLMGGEIGVTSTPGEGTTFRVVLPLPEASLPVAAVPGEEAAPEERPLRDTFPGRRALVADDSATNRLVISTMLGNTGIEIEEARDGREAVEMWQAAQEACGGAPYDVLMIDISMPELDGLACLEEIRRREREAGLPPAPAVAATANAMPQQIADYIVGGFDSYLSKPFRQRELLQLLGAFIPAEES
ncbi:hypothetical protein A3731_01935 [Roseovarius sp. HI0049]|nr:hypothetical protein A3731_01935 [Roseovarius sp. HI0049]